MKENVGIEVSQLNRLLSEFPWLWGICHNWQPESSGAWVSELAEDFLKGDFATDTEFWFYYKKRFGAYALTHCKLVVTGKFPMSLLSSFCRGEKIEYIAAVKREPHLIIEIFRPKKHSEIIELLTYLSRSKSE